MSESKLTAALIQFQKDVDKIEKNARANYGRFADLANVLSTVTPALLKNDLVLTQTFLEDSLVTTLRHVSGEEISSCCKLVLSEGRNKTQEWGKAVTYQRRYAICSILGTSADADLDGAMLEDSKPAEPAKPAPKKTVAKKAAPKPAPEPTPAPIAEPADQPLMKEEVDTILSLLIDRRKENVSEFEKIQKAFVEQFKIPSDCRFSESITTQAHLKFLNDLI
jgi:hypothetical protein